MTAIVQNTTGNYRYTVGNTNLAVISQHGRGLIASSIYLKLRIAQQNTQR